MISSVPILTYPHFYFQLTDIVTNFWDRLDISPYLKPLNKYPQSTSAGNSSRKIEETVISTEAPGGRVRSNESESTDARSESPLLGFMHHASSERSSFNTAKKFAETGDFSFLFIVVWIRTFFYSLS